MPNNFALDLALRLKRMRNLEQDFCNNVKTHLHAVKALGIAFKPKHHQLAHMVRNLLELGTPALWGNWREETENQDMKRIARAAHYNVWEVRILVNHRRAFGVRSKMHKTRGKRSRADTRKKT